MNRLHTKRWLAVIAAAVFLSGCSSGGQGKTDAGAKADLKTEAGTVSLYDRGLELMKKMDAMAENKEYAQLLTSSENMFAVMEEIGAEDYSKPEKVYQVKLSKETMDLLFQAYGGTGDSFPDDLRTDLERRMTAAVPTMFSAMEGTEVLAAVSLITAEDYFIDNSVSGNLIYFYLYDGSCCGAVVFSSHEEGIVSASGRMIKNQALNQIREQEELTDWLMENGGLMGIEISEVTP